MKNIKKPTYNLPQNLGYMFRTTWRVSRFLLVVFFGVELLTLLISLLELYGVPAILQKVENAAPLSALLTTIIGFTVTLVAFASIRSYLDATQWPSTQRLLDYFCIEINEKACVTSYPNTLDDAYLQQWEQGNRALYDSQQAPVKMISESARLTAALAGFVLYLLVLTGLQPLLLGVILVTAVVNFFVSRKVNQWGYRHREEPAAYRRRIHFAVNSAMGNEMPKDIRIFHMQPWITDIWNGALRLLEGFYARQERHYLMGNLLDVLLSFARNGIAYIYLIHTALTQGLPASEFLLYFSAVGGFTNWITSILDSVMNLYQRSLDMTQLRDYLQWPEPFRFSGGKPIPACDTYELKLEDVSYRYPEASKDTISHMDLTVSSGEKLAIVGLNGAGKTTLVKLLCGFLDPTQGRILLNGQDIRDFDRQKYYELFAAVFQEFSVLEDSIAVNVAQSETNIDCKKAAHCLELAGMAETIRALPKGMDTNLGKIVHDDGIQLSGGQMQRLMLARALYKNAPILMLDEPTAALDPIAENDIYLRYNDMAAGRTSVFISHRLASTRFCDRILFLEHGRIAEEGSHQALMALGGGYAQLFEVQSKYYREGGNDHEE